MQLPEIKGAFFYHIVLETLFERGHGAKALELMRTYWGEMLHRGAATWWETFDPSTPHCTVPSNYQGNTPVYLQDYIPVSLCHGWGASPTYLLIQHVLGINVLNLGSKVLHLSPFTKDLNWAKGEIPTRWGTIKVHWWTDTDKSIKYKLEIPGELQWEGNFDEELIDVEAITL
ncbi:MAG TPA: alpha-L-rhamnosidase C-terminal domain-containing protein [Bacilli bacterium]